MQKSKKVWSRPAFSVTSTGFEITMYLGTDTGRGA
jgi:coenzyme PQQ precursor peptide PqqA